MIAYIYPWDVVGDPAAPERLAGFGVDAVVQVGKSGPSDGVPVSVREA
ncbi:hypothetical protein GCM10022226_39530 [Sphaerisporangium flaviroseum]|uniref:Uncharacterized protein n=1 Tax=Sphaerisporangium flaviroseum TaxID=509199 RepID=A0ABP7ICA5_9ACTN